MNNKYSSPRVHGKFRLGVASLSLAGIVLGALAIANPLSLDVIKQSPVDVRVDSASTLPPDVQALEQQTARNAFDRDTATEHTAYDASQVTAQLEAATEVRAIKVFGAAPYSISVQAEVNGSWQSVSGLQGLNLATRAEAWATFTATTPVTTSKLRFQLTPAAGSTATGLKAIEIWGKASRVNVNGGLSMLTALRGTTPPSHGRLIAAAPEQGVIGGATDDLTDNTFAFTLGLDPAQIKRAYLAYEVLGPSHWVSVVRSVNGQTPFGGFTLPPSSDWTTQVEPVDPGVFKRGENRVAFSVPTGAASSYTVRKVYLVAELENGANFVASSASNQPEESNPTKNLIDGNLTTGWTPYPSGNVRADVPTVSLAFDKPSQIDGVSLYLVNSLKGSVSVDIQRGGVWSASGVTVADARKLVTGWNNIAIPVAAPVDGVRLSFSGGQGSSAEIKELQAIGSGVGPAAASRFTVTYPDAGQYYGRTAYIRGFLNPSANASGPAQLFAGASAVPSSNGSFDLTITKDDVGLSSAGDSEPWSVDLRAVYPDGATVIGTVILNNHQAAVESTDGNLLPTYKLAVSPGQAKKLAYDAATLDVPADAVGSEITIGITPLGEQEIPALDTGMTNVTKGPRHGYRFTPTPMKFKNKLKVSLPYNKSLIPPGHTEADIRTFYFDTQSGSWKALELVAVDPQAQTITSYTDHFTDMINATVTVPDHPQGVNFNPTLIKDIKAADPGAQVNLIDPPKANNMGDARLAYTIEVPPGRQGMQPQLAVQYNSSGGNGWMGMGWDLPMQAITIDTRWGVPRYDPALETETYMLNGEQLTPVAHRGELQPRTAEKVFHTRVEGQFRKIIRHGNHPNNYWWEVFDKNGTRYVYGGDPATNLPTANSTLTDGSGNVFLWSLRETRDTNDNFVKYHCERVSDTGVAGGTVPGVNLYLKKITYTGHGATEGVYAVTFLRDRELGEALRTDKQIDARGAFKRVTADRLRKVNVTFNGQSVRSYEFQYAEGAFHKTVLQRVIQYGEDGAEFNRHDFAYYDEARESNGNYKGFASSSDWTVGNDNVSAGLLGKGGASALGGTKGSSAGGHLYVGIGPFDGNLVSKSSTVGPKVGYSRSKSDTLLAMADMNGDSLPDKVFKGGSGFYYRPNQSGPNGTASFGAPVGLASLPAIGKEKVTTTTVGVEAYFGVSVLANRNNSETETTVYFSDVNGDGLTDLVSGGQVVFGYMNAGGVPTFSANSQNTPVPVGTGAVDTTDLLEDASALEAERAANFPLLDTLRRWVAPYDGVITVNAPVRLIEDTSPERAAYTGADGVRVAIQLEGAELWTKSIAATDYAVHTPTGVASITVNRGDRLYFRVQSVFDGAYDQVAWDPEITYLSVNTARTDVNGLTEYRYKASSDFTLAGRGGIVNAPLNGTLHLGGAWQKTGATTDDVTLQITKNGVAVFSQTLAAADVSTVNISQDISVAQNDALAWRILVDSPIDAAKITLSPTAYYTAATGVDAVTDDQGNYVIQINPPYEMDIYPVSNLTVPQNAYVATATGTLPVDVKLDLNAMPSGETADAVLTIKRQGILVAKHPISVIGTGASTQTVLTLNVPVTVGDELFFDLTSRQPTFLSQVSLFEIKTGAVVLPAAIHVPAVAGLFPQPYRGWGAAGYNGNGARASQPVDQGLLVLDSSYDPSTAKAYPYAPIANGSLWGGIDDLAWVKAGSASASRLGLDDIRVPTSALFAGASAVSRLSRSVNTSIGGGIGPFSGGTSQGDSKSLLDFQDMNGDRFPDVLGHGGVQYTRMVGGLEPTTRGNGVGNPRKSSNESVNLGIGGNMGNTVANGKGKVAPDGGSSAQTGSQGTDMPSLGGSAGQGTSDIEYDLIDINADGLPDRVYKNGTAALNLGYGFAAAEPWSAGIINHGESQNAGVSLGFNIYNYSIAGGLNLDTGTSRSDETYVDINGDGLPDKVIAGNPLQVRLNTGTGFASAIAWPGGHGKVAVDKHITLGGGAYFTYCIPIPPFPVPVVKICINPGVNLSTSMGRPELAFRDVDGDGYADHLFSDKDSNLKVAANPIGRTNLLKSVQRPLGAKIDIEYERDGNTYDQPQSRWVMNRVKVFDGHTGDGVDNLLTTYKYEGGKYDRLERDFYGYARVVEEQRNTAAGDALYRSVAQDFRTDSYYTKGLLAKEVTADEAGRPYLETEQTFVLKDVGTGTAGDGASTTATIFPQLVRTDKRFFEGQLVAQKATHTLHDYDALGNVVRFFDAGDSGAADDVDAYIHYSNANPACASRHIVGIALGIDVIGDGQLMRQRSSQIDCSTGDITQVSRFLANGQAAVTDLGYDAYGNLTRVTGPANASGQRFVQDYQFDPVVATHISRISDSFGYASTATHNYKYGKVETTTDLNNQKTTYVYDTVGRASTLTGPYEQGSGQATIRFEYRPEASVPYALTQHVDKTAAGVLRDPIETLLFTDGLKRVLQTKKDIALFTGQDSVPVDSMSVSGRVIFDFVGRAVEQFYPVTEAKGSNTAFNPAFDAIAPTRMAYDVLDRNVQTTIPDGTSTTLAYGFGADRNGQTQFETVVTDANGKQKKSYRDVRELITAVLEFNPAGGQPVIWTSYAYDPLKQIVKVVDDKFNTTAVAYDNFGRRTVIDNPDTGKTEHVYDLADNLTAKVTANLRAEGKQIAYAYDYIRLKAISYPNRPENNVAYTYGAPSAPENAAARIIKATSEAGIEERGYGPLGELTRQTWTIASDTLGASANSPEVYTTRYRYDTWNRMMDMVYPDGEVLTYAYDSGGLVRNASGVKNGYTYDYLKRLEYDKFEQRVFQELGNQVRTAYAYNPENRRLCALNTAKGGVTAGACADFANAPDNAPGLQALAYQYDAVGNILGLRNTIAVPPPNQYGGPSKQAFVYDDLYRLTSAQGRYSFNPSKTRTYQLDLAYDSIHNILSKQQADVVSQPSGTPVTQKKTSYAWNYEYNPSGSNSVRPHAPIHIGNRTFSYDANGNQTGWDNDDNGTRRNIVWDEENRIQSVFDNGHEKFYKYDDAGERVIKRGPQGETVYVNQYFTLRNREVGTKHVFVGQNRAVSKLMKQDKPGANPQGKTPVEKDLYYFHPDHLGSSNLITDTQGQLFEHLEYFPFGETWVEESSNTQRTPYLFTAKELDEETGLYYFGARYYDPRTSVWQSADPALGDYLPEDKAASSLAGYGGVFNSGNLGFYSYGHQNPILYRDPDGRVIKLFVAAAKIAIKGGDVYSTVSGIVDNAKIIASPNASIGEKIAAGLDIALDVGTGINTKDIKATARIVEGGAEKAGGAYKHLKATKGETERHHFPSKDSLKRSGSDVSRDDGPSVVMDIRDHRKTSSHGSKQAEAASYREEIADMIKEGDWRKAMAKEVRDVRRAAHEGSGDRTKYNRGLREALEYAKDKGLLDK